LRTETSK